MRGLHDKLYWRREGGVWHCFKRCSGKGYISLCRRETRDRSGGQLCARPPAVMRCGRCDGMEADRRGKDESMPESPEWRSHAP